MEDLKNKKQEKTRKAHVKHFLVQIMKNDFMTHFPRKVIFTYFEML